MILPDNLLLMVGADDMTSPHHTVLVFQYAFGQFRIRLTDTNKPDPDAPPGHGEIVREICTYNPLLRLLTVQALKDAADPEALAESWARPWNCEAPGGRIRLDTTEQDNPHRRGHGGAPT